MDHSSSRRAPGTPLLLELSTLTLLDEFILLIDPPQNSILVARRFILFRLRNPGDQR